MPRLSPARLAELTEDARAMGDVLSQAFLETMKAYPAGHTLPRALSRTLRALTTLGDALRQAGEQGGPVDPGQL